MSHEELIKAQQDDINKLVNLVRVRDKQIETYKETLNSYKYKPRADREYHYKMPYFRIDSYGIRVYALINVDESCWESGNIYTTYRFHDLFGFRLDDGGFGETTCSWGGRRSFTTCITYEALMKKLDRRVRINYKGKGSEYTKLIKDMQDELVKHKNWFTAFFTDVNEEEDNVG